MLRSIYNQDKYLRAMQLYHSSVMAAQILRMNRFYKKKLEQANNMILNKK